jgi:hypothetical protein
VIEIIRAWGGNRVLKNPEAYLKVAQRAKLDGVDLVVNDFAGKTSPEKFYLRTPDNIHRAIDVFAGAGLEVRLMSWLQPTEDFIKRAADALLPIADEYPIEALQFDIEEPFLHCRGYGTITYAEAAVLLKHQFADRPCPLEFNAIPHTKQEAFLPLASVGDALIPQCYVTNKGWSRWNVRPHHVKQWLDKWYKLYSQPNGDKPITVGLAAYSQTGMEGVEGHILVESAKVASEWGCTSAVYWCMYNIRSRAKIRNTLAGLRDILAKSFEEQ